LFPATFQALASQCLHKDGERAFVSKLLKPPDYSYLKIEVNSLLW